MCDCTGDIHSADGEWRGECPYCTAQPQQEPVAWVSENAGLYHGKPDESLNPLPLYLAPPPCPTCEALARTVMLDQTSHDARRKPLGEHEITKILDRERMKWHKSPPTYEFDLAFARAIEAAHGIKENT